MKSSQKRILTGALAVAMAGLYAMPYLTVYEMRQAIHQHDAAALSRHIDFPALKANLKATLSAGLVSKSAIDSRNPFARIGALLAGAAVDQYVDVLVTPQGVAYLLQGNSMAHAFRNDIQDDLAASAVPTHDTSAADNADMPTGNRMGYDGLNTFDVTLRPTGPDAPQTTLILKRSGLLFWKLAGIKEADR